MTDKILFLVAHPDDEAFGPAGTISKLSRDNEVTVVSLCNGARPGFEQVKESRSLAFSKSCALLGANSIIFDNEDCSLEYRPTLSSIEKIISDLRPSIVYTHSFSDIHRDHRLLAECCLIATRPKPGTFVNALYSFEIFASSVWTFATQSSFSPNVYVNIDDEVGLKKSVLSLYQTEVYTNPDPRSIDAVLNLAKMRGSSVGFDYAEAFQLIFSRNRKN